MLTLLVRALGLVALAVSAALSCSAQSASPDAAPVTAGSARPKICLVLSGGGARGAAHVGVLKVLEELRVPIDCIAGTSMGSLVGAAYATGMSVAEMEKIITAISTELLFKDKPPRQERSMRQKQDDYELFFGPELGIGGGKVTLAKGLVTGVQLETVLRRLSKVKGFHKFDDLPIPFRAVATDLVTGTEVVFHEGELANVMRASMSVPVAVAPAEIGGKMLVDGMLTSNLPVQVARDMGADIIIAVNVGTPLLKREQLNGVLGISSQMLSILTEQNVQASLKTLKPGDILITPELGDFSTGDFDNLPQITPLGEAAARKVAGQLARLAVAPEQYAALRRRQQVEVKPDLRPVDEIRFGTLRHVNPQTLQAAMASRAGKPIDQEVLDRDMRSVYGTGDFEAVNYRFLEEQSRRIMVVDAVEKTWGLDTLRFGLGLSSDFKGDAYFNLIGSYRKRWINSLGAEWRTDAQIGRTSSVMTEFYQPLNPAGYLFIVPHASYERRTADLYRDDERVASYDMTSALAGLAVGGVLGRYGELRLGVVAGTLRPELDTGPEALSPGESKLAQGAFTMRLILDQMDSVHFPRSGWRSSARVFKSSGSLGADVPYTKWDADFNGAYSFGNHTINVGLKVGGAIGSDPLPRFDMFQWGGFVQQSGYATGQLAGESIKYGRLLYYHRILRGTVLEGAYGGASIEFGKVDQPLVPGNSDALLKSASLFIAADSPVGPLYLAYGHAKDGNSSWYFYVGRPF